MEYLTAKIPLLSADLLGHVLASGATGISGDDITGWLQDYAAQVQSQPTELSFIRPDYESIKQQLQAKLIDRPAWKDIIQASGGETLLEFIATIGAYSQMASMRGLQESMLGSARLSSSIYAIARMLGVHITRKQPAQVQAALTVASNAYAYIPRMSQFSVGGVPFFNRDGVVFTPGAQTQMVTLYQGTVLVETLSGTGRAFQVLEVGSNDYTIADQDIMVVNDSYLEYVRKIDGLWHYEGQQYVFYENTTPNGNVEVRFGNNLFGRSPLLNEQLNVIYAVTLGQEANTSQTGLAVTITQLNDVVPDRIRGNSVQEVEDEIARVTTITSGNTISAVINGDTERDKDFYRTLAPFIYSSRGRNVTRTDYYANSLTYPGMADILFQGQKELAPKNRNFINVVGVTPLTKGGGIMTPSEWEAFTAHLDTVSIGKAEYMHIEPQEVQINVSGKVFCMSGADVPKVKTYIEYRMAEKFGIQRGSLGYSVYLNDIHAMLKANHHTLQVDYADLDSPGVDFILTKTQFPRLNTIDIAVDFSTRFFTGYVPNRGEII